MMSAEKHKRPTRTLLEPLATKSEEDSSCHDESLWYEMVVISVVEERSVVLVNSLL
jgi:hypothetical protein